MSCFLGKTDVFGLRRYVLVTCYILCEDEQMGWRCSIVVEHGLAFPRPWSSFPAPKESGAGE
jgi:hypothetical protein